ncbi:MAG: HD-GYP domain-containing protein [Candidatus Marinarcus sp.]|uniref:HD-GYP domain-containing protein n=1 Tax=Candidatus Marinarcus sp. TaxID=3100987 RepID=UPI003B008734
MQTENFRPISKEILVQGESYAFTIYKQMDKELFSLFLEKETPLIQSKASLCVDEKCSALFIKTEDRTLYQSYIQNNINTLLDDETIPLDNKTLFINEIASATMYYLFNHNITTEILHDVDTTVKSSIKLILSDTKAMYSMLKTTSYDYYTYTHCIDVASYAIGFGAYLGFDEATLIRLGKAAMMHDIGKKFIDHNIITKNGKLTPEEFDEVKKHPSLSVTILEELNECDEILLRAIGEHHEKCDGTGYPKGLKEDQINDLAKIVSICDVFNALTTRRSYKERMSTYEAFGIMFGEMKKDLSEKLLNKFVSFMGCQAIK